jgi:hypothetical protein
MQATNEWCQSIECNKHYSLLGDLMIQPSGEEFADLLMFMSANEMAVMITFTAMAQMCPGQGNRNLI